MSVGRYVVADHFILHPRIYYLYIYYFLFTWHCHYRKWGPWSCCQCHVVSVYLITNIFSNKLVKIFTWWQLILSSPQNTSTIKAFWFVAHHIDLKSLCKLFFMYISMYCTPFKEFMKSSYSLLVTPHTNLFISKKF